MKLIPGSQPRVCKAARKISLPQQDRVNEKPDTMLIQGILEPVPPNGVTNPQWFGSGKKLKFYDYAWTSSHKRKFMDEEYPIQEMETSFRNLHGASHFGKINLSDVYYQIELDEDAKNMYN